MKYLRGCKIEQIDIADDFYEAYKRCFEGKNPHKDEHGRIVRDIVAIPGFVNGLFACELYFKWLLDIDDKVNEIKARKSHNIKELFDLLDESIKNELKENDYKSDYNLEDLLSKIGKGFVEWRYIFKKNKKEGLFGNRINRYVPALTILLEEISIIAKNRYESNK